MTAPPPTRYANLLATYRELLAIEERVLHALSLTHGTHAAQYRKQHNKTETLRRQVAELEKLFAEEARK